MRSVWVTAAAMVVGGVLLVLGLSCGGRAVGRHLFEERAAVRSTVPVWATRLDTMMNEVQLTCVALYV